VTSLETTQRCSTRLRPTAKRNLANALAALGGREGGTTRLGEAVAANREALKEFNNLGYTQRSGRPVSPGPHDVEVRDRVQDAISCVERVLAQGLPIADPLKARIDLLLGEHMVNAALLALDRKP